MKLLTRLSRSYLIITLIVFLISGGIFDKLLKHIFQRQIDETLAVEQLLVEQTINYSDSVPDFRLVFGHMIDVTIVNNPLARNGFIHDTLMYDSESGEFASFRHLFAENTSVRNKGYTINIYIPLSETEQLITEILLFTALIFISLMIILVIANYFIARRAWIPFYRILEKLSQYQIDQSQSLTFDKTSIHEFNLLIEALEKMSSKIVRDYVLLREFNENAAHELQTPLAIIRSKLEMIIQKENLDEEQLLNVSAIMEATHRITRLNQGLLLISKIDNNQFSHSEQIKTGPLLEKILDHYEELADHRHLQIRRVIDDDATVRMNLSLAETMFSNLISNAIRHNNDGGFIEIILHATHFTITNPGIPLKSDPEVLFQRFRRSGTHPDSVGLGLSIVKHIADLYHFRITYHHSDGIHSIRLDFVNHPLQN